MLNYESDSRFYNSGEGGGDGDVVVMVVERYEWLCDEAESF